MYFAPSNRKTWLRACEHCIQSFFPDYLPHESISFSHHHTLL